MSDKQDLSRWRLEKAEQCLRSARTLFNDNDYSSALNRSYYCVFHCIRSLLALDGIDFRKHSGVIAYFRENYIKSGIFTKQLSDILGKLFMIRNESDYDDFFIISKQEIVEQIENAAFFFNQIQGYLDSQNANP